MRPAKLRFAPLPGEYHARLATPFAVLGVRAAGDCLVELALLPPGAEALAPQTAFAREVCKQLRAYLKNARFAFDLPYRQDGTEFQQRAWAAVQDIPVGEVRSYGQIAKALRSGARAIGGICGANRLPLVIPCHRVVSSSGIGGYMHVRAGQPLAIKRWLLAHEGVEFR